jgi:hypothetical protein
MGVFAEWAPLYRAAGFWPRPVWADSKSCYLPKWETPDPELPPETLSSWLSSYGDYGIGLAMGSPFPDGTTLGALDVDHDDYRRLGLALLSNPACRRIGSKGFAAFVRISGDLKNFEFRVTGEAAQNYGKVAECLFTRRFCVIPPTIHPKTDTPYRWVGKSLLETNFEELPIVEI